MDSVKVFLSGKMSGLSLEEQTKWRNQIKNAIKYGDYDTTKNVLIFSPPDYYSTETNKHKSEKEAFNFDLYNLRNSDLVIVNADGLHSSVGSIFEIATAYELRIPIIVLNDKGCDLHPWIIECCTRECKSMRELVEHITEFYLS